MRVQLYRPINYLLVVCCFNCVNLGSFLGDRLFANAGPRIWSSLRSELRHVDSYIAIYLRFKGLLKGQERSTLST